jgi:hypothetical protein
LPAAAITRTPLLVAYWMAFFSPVEMVRPPSERFIATMFAWSAAARMALMMEEV